MVILEIERPVIGVCIGELVNCRTDDNSATCLWKKMMKKLFLFWKMESHFRKKNKECQLHLCGFTANECILLHTTESAAGPLIFCKLPFLQTSLQQKAVASWSSCSRGKLELIKACCGQTPSKHGCTPLPITDGHHLHAVVQGNRCSQTWI